MRPTSWAIRRDSKSAEEVRIEVVRASPPLRLRRVLFRI
jgi:hypothetical protein